MRQARKNDNPEERLQRDVVRYLDLALPEGCGVFWSATMNGVRVSPVIRSRLKASGVRPGVYDLLFVVLWNVGSLKAGDTYHLELKAPKGQPTPEQKLLMAALRPAGRGEYARSVEEVCAILTEWGFPLKARL